MLLNINEKLPRLIFVYIRGEHHYALIRPLALRNPDYHFYLHSNFVTEDQFRKSELHGIANVHFVQDFRRIVYKLNLFGAFITTDAHAVHAHFYSLKLIRLFRRMGTPVYELQHGMFQIGLHYYDLPHDEYVGDDSLPTTTFADKVLAYYPPVSRAAPFVTIGYPPYDLGCCRKTQPGEYVLVMSNLHWQTYSHEEKHAFYYAVMEYARRHEETLFIWRMHPGEAANKACAVIVNGLFALYPELRKRLIFQRDSMLLAKTGVEGMVRQAKAVISTVSTVLMDCEIAGKPTAVYACKTNACLIGMLESKDAAFSNVDELENVMSRGTPFSSGLLRPYDNAAFRMEIENSYKPSALKQGEWLELVISEVE